MAGTRRKLHKTTESVTPRRSARNGRKARQDEEGVPAVFQEMLREEQATKATSADEDDNYDNDKRPAKKRKTVPSPKSATNLIQKKPAVQSQTSPSTATHSPLPTRPSTALQAELHTNNRVRQTIVDSDESDDSDMEWEDALADDDEDDADEGREGTRQVGDISITLGGNKAMDTGTKRKVRRRAITSVDKKRRLDIHKMHILCLLYHVHRRNTWCNDRRVQSVLRKIVPSKTLTSLVPDPEITQYSASKRFIDGMNELKSMWSKRFNITAQGMYKPRWAEVEASVRPFSDFDELDDPMDKDEFRTAAYTLRGSQDLGTQLFCALLRAIGLEARLVCSLQPLPFASAAERATPQKAATDKNVIVVDPYNTQAEQSPTKSKSQTPRSKRLSKLERVMGERHAVLNNTGVAPKKQKAYHTAYPVYWVEVLNPSYQKWVCIDTHSTFTVNAPEKLEPPLSFAQNTLCYAIAFDEDYTAKDVTRRYAKAYNAKTRKYRVESTPGGQDWWRRTMRFFKRASPLDRDQLEDAALARKEAAEGIPRNVQDFKGHPVYVLERHLKHNEVIHPLVQVGKVNCGTAMNPKMEPIYRRTNVHLVRTADKWYRLGRDVKTGEQPLKRAKPKKGRRPSIGEDMDVDEQADDVSAGLFAEFQTELYIPPPVVRGRVPRNAYGNLDLYVPSMCPPGGTHIRHKLAAKAARIVGVDSADAVTGFSFKGRHGTAIIQGVVVAQEYADAVQAVIDGMECQQEEAEAAARTAESLRLWRRFLVGLRVTQRVNAIVIDGERGPQIDVQDEISRQDRELAAQEMAGGFFPDEGDVAEPSVSSGYQAPQQDYGDGGFVPESYDDGDGGGGGFMPEASAAPISMPRHQSFESSILDSQQLLPRRQSSLGQVYSSEDDEESGGCIREGSPQVAVPRERVDTPEGQLMQMDGAADNAGGFIPEVTPETVDMQSTNKDSGEAAPETPNSAPNQDQDTKTSSPPIPSSPSEANSLPLEDPEDEDADPDWLVEAT
ncbi:RAD4 DNA repair protein RAD4 [Pyrenophora tritici-repentis]|uniref:DNA repair protein Rhp41 n=2 Tax=Pyrenophora tritici-repentis TaxID=45151 RepID=A0A2W1E5U4_9PLEO|nr:DNA repair protein Rhp41 [Pyrenophora tritici-repentis Pt-1C-BFP]KAA8626224.1 DNA repair protein Rhp41 [Pyrenophora tritici-repentis]EDU41002.1 DNA repair protein Rhp41 [Pyrenophora tritici-repentis Pt-1C-BFP]KAF7454637.1 DNA repair protein Rhp41 [Pyrenophora tritici-repentis]KAF7577763.1 RAD4, DNA repair protein RAD4 [Pyrenophora tritici-repentis]KAG9388393.1 DNA repair protein Rhp41 [Pyrenophora tritici-repentis]